MHKTWSFPFTPIELEFSLNALGQMLTKKTTTPFASMYKRLLAAGKYSASAILLAPI
jgi:hypothetical protein